MDKELYNDPNVSNAEIINRDTLERMKAKKRHKKFFRRINYILLTIVLCFVFIIVCMALFLKIESIEVKGNERYTSEQIVEVSGITVGQNMYSISKPEAKRLIIAEYPYVSDVVIRRTLPSTLTFRITEDIPAYYTEICGEYYILSDTLRVLERTEELPTEELGLIRIMFADIKSVIVGEYIGFNKDITFEYIDSFIQSVNVHERRANITSIDLSRRYNIYVYYEDRFKIYLGDNTETEMKLTFAGLMIDTFEPHQRGEVDAHDITVGSVILEN
ncbi:MAG: FtsQ-type POTRA domain-containing protein [Ruminococcaceae bacterium]|nr:FtsQ-type POTRA domain-containing protein [Oscillospiraceae bacterium]